MHQITDNTSEALYERAVKLLRKLIAIPSFSREEQGTAQLLKDYLQSENILANRMANNVWA